MFQSMQRWIVLALGAMLSLLMALPAPAQTPSAEVTELRLERSADTLYLDASVQFEISALVEDVLDKGVPLHFVVEAELIRERWYWFDRRLAQTSRYLRLAYQPLTRRWRLNSASVPITNAGFGGSFSQNFDRLSDALDAVKRIGRLRLGDASDLGDENLHLVQFRFRLDTSQLPRPLQIGVVGQPDWSISADRRVKLVVEKPR
jgi:hypothetical protein